MTPLQVPPLADLADLASIRAAFEHATLKGKADLDDPQKAVDAVRSALAEAIQRAVYPVLSAKVIEVFHEAHDRHELVEGDRPRDPGEAADWDEGLATAIETWIGPDASRILGQGWLGEALIGPRLYDAGVREKTAAGAAYLLAQHYSHLPAAAVGLDEEDIMSAARRRLKQAVEQPLPAKPPAGDAALAASLLGAHLRDLADLDRLPDTTTLAQEVELIGDYDDVLTPGALQRLGLDAGVQPHISAYREANGRNWAEQLILVAMDAPEPPEAPEVPAETKAAPEPSVGQETANPPAAKRKRNRQPPERGQAAAGGPGFARTHAKSVSGALALIAAHAGKSGRDLAEALGVTQTNWSKMSTGKMPPALNREQLETLTNAIKADYQGLGEAVERLEKAMLA